jgi:hypothetical protein
MSHPTNAGHRLVKHRQRLAWLLAHPALVAQLPSATQDVDRAGSDALDRALRGMQLEKLYAVHSTPDAVRWGSAPDRVRGAAGTRRLSNEGDSKERGETARRHLNRAASDCGHTRLGP